MNFNEFVNEVKDNIKLFLPRDYENAEVSTMECQKLNRAYTGLMVRKEGEMLTPTINLNRLYEAYKAQPGVTMETVCRKIADIVIEAPIQVDLKAILNYEDVKDKLFIRVSSAEANKEVLEIVPHQLKEDLAITYHVAVGKNQDGLSSMLITNEMMKEYGVTQEQIHEDAMKSSPRVMVPEVSSIGVLIDEIYQKNILMLTPDEREMLLETLQESKGIDLTGTYEFRALDIGIPMPGDSDNDRHVFVLDGNNAEKMISLQFQHGGVYRYHLVQTSKDKENYTYDRSSYIIAVYIKNGENGKLVPQVIAEKNDGKKYGELMFYNSYNKRNI